MQPRESDTIAAFLAGWHAKEDSIKGAMEIARICLFRIARLPNFVENPKLIEREKRQLKIVIDQLFGRIE